MISFIEEFRMTVTLNAIHDIFADLYGFGCDHRHADLRMYRGKKAKARIVQTTSLILGSG